MIHDDRAPGGKSPAEIYGEHYYTHYSHAGDNPYRPDDPIWQQFFGGVAQRIAADLRPRSVLDAGCAMGMLVAALRDREIEAWGVDISDYAIGQVRQDVRAYCRVGSVIEDFGRDYDLITCIEVLEHLSAEDAERAVDNFARHSANVLLSSTPDDFREPTHLNVQPSDYWVGLFARHGLYRDLLVDVFFVTPHSMLFRRERGQPINTLRVWQSHNELRALRASYQESIDAQGRQETDLEHHELERGMLAGEVVKWEWQAAQARGRAEEWEQRAREAERQLAVRAVPVRRRLANLRSTVLRSTVRSQATVPATNRETSGADAPPQAAGRARRVLFISNADDSDVSRRYRCGHQAEALQIAGWSADVVSYEDVFGSLTNVIDAYDAFVLHRLPLRPGLEWFMDRAREHGKPLLYETDDLVFDPRMTRHWAPVDSMSDDERRLTAHGMWRNGLALLRCDGVIVATEPLAGRAHKMHRRVCVSTNAVSNSLITMADEALQKRQAWREGDPVTLAYVSGTSTHNRDFRQAADAVRRALENYPTTRLLIIGPLDLPAAFSAFEERVQQVSLQPPEAVPALLAQISINLAPLEPNNPFTEAKSCLKYLEAGLLGVPTIASPRYDFVTAIRDGENGLLADSPEVWHTGLSALIESPATRARIGAHAREDVLERHTTATRGRRLQTLIDDLIKEHSGERI
jgi:glycosyltransferase involved in cell wall biosynthesis